MRIQWTAPHDGSDKIIKYTIQIMPKGSTIGQEVTQCHGSGE